MFDAPTRSFMFIPARHAALFQNVSDTTPARLLVMFTPAGMERFFEGVTQLSPGSFDPDVYRAIAHSAGAKIVGPPLAETDPL